jgi:hypothetical protein
MVLKQEHLHSHGGIYQVAVFMEVKQFHATDE